MVKYVTCNGEGFTVYLEDNQKFDKFVQRIQCVKLSKNIFVYYYFNLRICLLLYLFENNYSEISRTLVKKITRVRE